LSKRESADLVENVIDKLRAVLDTPKGPTLEDLKVPEPQEVNEIESTFCKLYDQPESPRGIGVALRRAVAHGWLVSRFPVRKRRGKKRQRVVADESLKKRRQRKNREERALIDALIEFVATSASRQVTHVVLSTVFEKVPGLGPKMLKRIEEITEGGTNTG
jgi:hypothetical protein